MVISGETNITKVLELNKKTFQQLEPQDIQRGIGWKLKTFEFSNLFGYGEDNFVNFENLNGITGLFAKNKEGKSSFINGILYTIFNSTPSLRRCCDDFFSKLIHLYVGIGFHMCRIALGVLGG